MHALPHRLRSFGSSTEVSVSPTRLIARIVTMITSPGNVEIHQLVTR